MPTSGPSTPVGFIGLGNLGENMALALVHAGWDVLVHDRDPQRADRCSAAGAAAAAAPDELADCAAVALAVPDDDAVAELLEGRSGAPGLLDTLAAGSVVLIHSTVLPDTARRLSRRGSDRGLSVLDAPVSGGPDRARDGDLTIVVGGEADRHGLAWSLLDTLGSTVTPMGPAGAGAVTKLANQLMMFATLAGVHEAAELAGTYGVATGALLEALSTSTSSSWVAQNWGFFDRVARDYDRAGTPVGDRPWGKDLHEVVQAAREAGVSVPIAALLSQTLADRVEAHARTHGGT